MPTKRKLDKIPSKGYTIIWTVNSFYNKNATNDGFTEFLKTQMANETFVNLLKASKIRMTLRGFYNDIKNDIRKLYYSISEIKVYGR